MVDEADDSETDQREDRFYFKEVHFLRRLRLSTLAPKFQSSLPDCCWQERSQQ